MNKSTRRLPFLAGALALTLIAAACGDDDSDDTSAETTVAADTTPAADTTAAAGSTAAPGGNDVSGDVVVTGSSTVEPISIKVGELIGEQTGGGVAVSVKGPGTGDGFKEFCAGEADISDASRPIKDEEAQACADAGVEFTELEVAIDGLTVGTSVNNSAVECIDVAGLYALIGPESEGFAKWSDANDLAAEVGSKYAPFPDAPLSITGPGEESGTYDSFVEFAIADLAEERGQDENTRADYTASPNDNVIVEGIEGSDTSLGWVGFAYYVGEQDRMKAIGIDSDDAECVVPTEETIADGSYPFSRTLYIYVNNAKAAENPAVKAYVDLYVSAEGLALAGDAGYVVLPEDRAQASADAWAAVG